jgi:hypothetical protein
MKGHGQGQPWSNQGQLAHGHGSPPPFVSLEKTFDAQLFILFKQLAPKVSQRKKGH